MSILERLEQMERRMAEMSNNNQHMNHFHHQQQSRNQSAAPRLTPENQVHVCLQFTGLAVYNITYSHSGEEEHLVILSIFVELKQ